MCCFKDGQTVKIRQRGTDLEQLYQPVQKLSQNEPDRASYVSWDSEPGAANVLETKLLEAQVVLREKEREHQMLKEEAKGGVGRKSADKKQQNGQTQSRYSQKSPHNLYPSRILLPSPPLLR
jgi:hypothetical protein